MLVFIFITILLFVGLVWWKRFNRIQCTSARIIFNKVGEDFRPYEFFVYDRRKGGGNRLVLTCTWEGLLSDLFNKYNSTRDISLSITSLKKGRFIMAVNNKSTNNFVVISITDLATGKVYQVDICARYAKRYKLYGKTFGVSVDAIFDANYTTLKH